MWPCRLRSSNWAASSRYTARPASFLRRWCHWGTARSRFSASTGRTTVLRPQSGSTQPSGTSTSSAPMTAKFCTRWTGTSRRIRSSGAPRNRRESAGGTWSYTQVVLRTQVPDPRGPRLVSGALFRARDPHRDRAPIQPHEARCRTLVRVVAETTHGAEPGGRSRILLHPAGGLHQRTRRRVRHH